jgi:hypothetical protein
VVVYYEGTDVDWLFARFEERTDRARSPDSALGIATTTGWTDEGTNLSFLHVVQTGSGAYPASYLMGAGGSFPGSKAAGGVKLTTHVQLLPRSRIRGFLHPLPHTSSWRSA